MRKYTKVEVYDKIEIIINRLTNYKEGKELPFNWIMEDPSGNSFI